MKVAFCITVKDRLQHVKETLPKNLASNCADCVYILLDYGSTDGLKEYLRAFHSIDIAFGKLVVYEVYTSGPFRMAHAKNMAHRCGILEGADILVNMDADNFTGIDFASYLEDNVDRGSFMWARMIQRCGIDGCILPRGHRESYHSDCEADLFVRYAENERPRRRGISGRIAVTAESFLKVGGYDERYAKWGPDDKDFNARLIRLGLRPREIDARYLDAIHHGPKLRFKEYPDAEPAEGTYEHPIVPEPDTCVVNFGRFGCGWVRRNFVEAWIELEPIPTRVFGIGMHKTGTTSLNSALNILGFDSSHWTNPRRARAIWLEMQALGKSLTLERHYAACDLPIAILYEKLDKAYPGSKFILTIRDEASWISSVARHWSYTHNKYRASWDTDCFTHRVHRELYGCQDFDDERFLGVYQRHNAAVIEHFKDRPDDLLVMKEHSWDPLCNFLHRSVPFIPYPKVDPYL